MVQRVSNGMYLMVKLVDGVHRYAPLFVHFFRLIAPRKIMEADRFNRQYHSYEEIESIPDRLRWCRHHLGLTQSETAELAGISRMVYMEMEKGVLDCYEKEVVDKLAELFGISPFDLLDDYNRFLYLGQGKMALECRKRSGLSRKAFARSIGAYENSVYCWETEKKHMTKRSWEKYYKDRME